MRVVAAMSGGVDSAVAASRMMESGHEVVGVHLALSQSAATLRESARGCCTIEDAGDARRVADRLGIPFYVWDMAERFAQDVVADFIAEYEAGRTPNPCLRCNEKIKFAALLDKALALGFDAVATGHYAQIVEAPDEAAPGGVRRELHRAVDMAKDQSYVLGVLDADQLARSFF
ncbi:MAG: tRNA 2-thiouridine(34) synthase MnmA, partial [Ornithinimicrobium sp.]